MQLPVQTPSAMPTKELTKHVLVVDDDREVTDLLTSVLNREGYQVSIARDGNVGIANAQARRPDLLILDMMMPKRSGFLVLEYLRNSDSPSIPVIMITANEGRRHKQYAELLGVNAYLHKPFGIDNLLQTIGDLLAESES
jgi:DNA-binding response OmpR family regulator